MHLMIVFWPKAASTDPVTRVSSRNLRIDSGVNLIAFGLLWRVESTGSIMCGDRMKDETFCMAQSICCFNREMSQVLVVIGISSTLARNLGRGFQGGAGVFTGFLLL